MFACVYVGGGSLSECVNSCAFVAIVHLLCFTLVRLFVCLFVFLLVFLREGEKMM